MAYQILRLPQFKIHTGLSRSSIYLRMAEGTSPKQINLGSRAVCWESGDIQHWIKQRLAASRMEG